MGRNHVVVALVGLALALALGCGGKKGGEGGKPKVAVSIFPLYDLTRRIAGDRVEVILVLPPGKSEHGYDPTPKEIARLSGSKLAIAVGLDMDTWVENIMRTAGGAKVIHVGDAVKTVPIDVEPIGEEEAGHEHGDHHDDHDEKAGSAAGSAAAKHDDHDDHDDHDKKSGSGSAAGSAATAKHDDHDDHDDHDKKSGSGSAVGSGSAAAAKHDDDDHDEHGHAEVGAPDPHVWMDPERMLGVVDLLAAELTAMDPAGKETYAKNADTLKASLREVDAKISTRSKAWTKRTIVTFHGSMAYFAKRYNVRIAAVVEPIAGKEPTAAYIAEVIGAIKISKATALFSEPQLDRGPGEMIAKEAGIPLGELDPIGGVAGRDTYEALLVWNTDQLEKVLK